jgi:hypothetical protein
VVGELALVREAIGVRGLQILLAPADYFWANGARLGPIAELE